MNIVSPLSARVRGLGLGLVLCTQGLLVACGGADRPADAGAYTPPDLAALAQICAPENPLADFARGQVRAGSLTDEKAWMRAFLQSRYLWYQDLQEPDPQAQAYRLFDAAGRLQVFESLQAYFHDQLSPRLGPSGRPVDRFSFMIGTDRWNRFENGQSLGFGWMLRHDGLAGVRVAHVYPVEQPGQAFTQGVQRGDRILSVNGQTLEGLETERLMALLEPATPGTYRFVIEAQASPGRSRTVELEARRVALAQAQYRTFRAGDALWGYLLFNSHVEAAEPVLLEAIAAFERSGIDELVLDLRFNTGGYLAIASALARALAGEERTQGRVFEQTRFNDKRSAENFSMGFLPTTLFSEQAYAQLQLSRLYVLTSGQTCSASESLINALRGVDMPVILIGETTCGKPYGFYPQDNCGITYAALEFEGVNDKGEGGFAEGFAPTCPVQDDDQYPLGDIRERLLATALAHRQGQACPTPPPAAASVEAGWSGGSRSGPRLSHSAGLRQLFRPNR